MLGFKKVLILLGLLILFAYGILGLMANLPWQEANQIVKDLVTLTPPISRLAGFLLMALIPIFILFLRRPAEKAPRDAVIARPPEGDIIISAAAVTKCIRQILSRMPEILSVSAGIKDTSKGVLIKAKAQVQISKDTLPLITKQMREKVKETVTKVLGITNIADINIIVEEIKLPATEEPGKIGSPSVVEKKKEPGLTTESIPKKRFP